VFLLKKAQKIGMLPPAMRIKFLIIFTLIFSFLFVIPKTIFAAEDIAAEQAQLEQDLAAVQAQIDELQGQIAVTKGEKNTLATKKNPRRRSRLIMRSL
jgi:cell division protein FtsB